MPDKSTYDSVVASEVLWGILSGGTPTYRNPELDQTYDCWGTANENTEDQGVLNITLTLLGTWLNVGLSTTATLTTTLTLTGEYITALVAEGDAVLKITLTLSASGFTIDGTEIIPFAGPVKSNWIQWSDIGSLVFTTGQDNVAGERPMDWAGNIYAVKKLINKPIVYGENGVSILIPSGTVFGLNTIYTVGLKSKHAVTGDDTKHFFIDKDGKLWKLTDTLDLLDYSEYLSTLIGDLVMSYDSLNNMVYICDGSKGYIYDVATKSLGESQNNITGIGYKSGTLYIAATATVVTDPFQICTDIQDLGTRNAKTIYSLEFGVNLVNNLYAAIDWRRNKSADFTQTFWYRVWNNGKVPIVAYGQEFRFRARTTTYEAFDLDYIKVNGVAHAA